MIPFEALGISRDELINKIVDAAVEDLLSSVSTDDEGNSYKMSSRLREDFNTELTKRISSTVSGLVDSLVTPEYIRTTTFPRYSKYGEKKGDPLTFKEFVEQCVNKILDSRIDDSGKILEPGSYGYDRGKHFMSGLVEKTIERELREAIQKGLINIQQEVTNALKAAATEIITKITASIK